MLQLAEAWGVPPWVIEDHEDGEYWAERWVVYHQEREAAREKKKPTT